MEPRLDKARQYRQMALGFLCFSLLIVSLNNIIVNIALPSIAEDLQATYSSLQWIVDAYILTFGAFLLTMGSIGDRIGRKRILITGLTLFALFSAFAGLSPSISQLILLRGFMGIAAAMIMPSTLSILTETFENTSERSQAIAIWAATYGLGVGISPLIAGFLLDRFSWNSVFFVNIPLVTIAILGGFFFINESSNKKVSNPDIPSVTFSIVGLIFLFLAIIEAGKIGGNNTEIYTSFALAAIFIGAFMLREINTKNPMLPLYLFENSSFTGANIALAFVMFSLFGTNFCLNQYLQIVLGYNAREAGIALLPMALVVMTSSILSAKVAEKFGIKLTIAASILIVAIGLSYMALVVNTTTSYSTLLAGMILIGFGLGTATGPATDSIMGAVPIAKANVGSAMNDTTRELGGALGVALLGSILNSEFRSQLNDLRVLDLLPRNVYETIIGGIVGSHHFATYIQLPGVQGQFLGFVDRAFVTGLKDALFVGAIIMALVTLLAYAILPSEIKRSEK